MIEIGISVAGFAIAGGVFAFVRYSKNKKALLAQCNGMIERCLESCEKMKTIGNLSSGFYANNVFPIYQELSSFQDGINSGKVKINNSTIEYILIYHHRIVAAELQQS